MHDLRHSYDEAVLRGLREVLKGVLSVASLLIRLCCCKIEREGGSNIAMSCRVTLEPLP